MVMVYWNRITLGDSAISENTSVMILVKDDHVKC